MSATDLAGEEVSILEYSVDTNLVRRAAWR